MHMDTKKISIYLSIEMEMDMETIDRAQSMEEFPLPFAHPPPSTLQTICIPLSHPLDMRLK